MKVFKAPDEELGEDTAPLLNGRREGLSDEERELFEAEGIGVDEDVGKVMGVRGTMLEGIANVTLY